MCGIIGICSLKDAVSTPPALIIRRGLEKLEYRGYDSVGIASIHDNKIIIRKGKGKIREVNAHKRLDGVPGLVVIGHTRWATHGRPSDENAHPHIDCKGEIAVVHNGIIQNYYQLKQYLEERGHRFRSETDTEVIPHLIEEGLKRSRCFFEAFREAVRKLKGSYALGVITVFEPDKIFFARKDSPLIVGLGNGYNFIASDIPAFLDYTRKIVVVHDHEIGYISPHEVYFEDINGRSISISNRIRLIDWTPEMAAKAGYPHFMLKEIHEQPIALANTLRGLGVEVEKAAEILLNAERVFLAAAGTSYHACLVADYLMSTVASKPTIPFISSEYKKYRNCVTERDVLLAVSQSGETIDTLMAVRNFKNRGATIISLSNVIESAIPRESDLTIYTRAGPEIGVAATKTFTTQVLSLAAITVNLAFLNGSIDRMERKELLDQLSYAPKIAEKSIMVTEGIIREFSRELSNKNNAYYLGRGIGVPVAMEGALKLKEIAYIHAEAYPAGESKHGPIALVEQGFPVLFIIMDDNNYTHILGNIEEMSARDALTIGIVPEGDKEASEKLTMVIKVPRSPWITSPITYTPPLQLLAYYVCIERGYDPDKPRNLAKTVTVE